MQDDIKTTGNNTPIELTPEQALPAVPHKPTPMSDATGALSPLPTEGGSATTPTLSELVVIPPLEEQKEEQKIDPQAVSGNEPLTPEDKTTSKEVPEVKSQKSFEDQIAEIESTLEGFATKRVTIEDKSTGYFSEHKVLEDALAPILLKEKLSVERLREIGEKEDAVRTGEERREISKQRWEEEDKRRVIEAEKWPIFEKLAAVEKNIKESEHAFMAVVSEEEVAKADIARLKIGAKQRDLHTELDKIGGEKEATEEQLTALREEHSRLATLIADSQKKEKVLEADELKLDEKADVAGSFYEERILAEERHKIEEDRRKAEEAEWKAEDEIATVADSEKKSAAEMEVISAKEADVVAKLSELE